MDAETDRKTNRSVGPYYWRPHCCLWSPSTAGTILSPCGAPHPLLPWRTHKVQLQTAGWRKQGVAVDMQHSSWPSYLTILIQKGKHGCIKDRAHCYSKTQFDQSARVYIRQHCAYLCKLWCVGWDTITHSQSLVTDHSSPSFRVSFIIC